MKKKPVLKKTDTVVNFDRCLSEQDGGYTEDLRVTHRFDLLKRRAEKHKKAAHKAQRKKAAQKSRYKGFDAEAHMREEQRIADERRKKYAADQEESQDSRTFLTVLKDPEVADSYPSIDLPTDLLSFSDFKSCDLHEVQGESSTEVCLSQAFTCSGPLPGACSSTACVKPQSLDATQRSDGSNANAKAEAKAKVQARAEALSRSRATLKHANGNPSQESCMNHNLVTVSGITHPRYGATGKYFLFKKCDWSSVVGTWSSGDTFDVVQTRGGIEVWSGTVKVWDNDNGVYGLREPIAEAANNQWQTGDILTIRRRSLQNILAGVHREQQRFAEELFLMPRTLSEALQMKKESCLPREGTQEYNWIVSESDGANKTMLTLLAFQERFAGMADRSCSCTTDGLMRWIGLSEKPPIMNPQRCQA